MKSMREIDQMLLKDDISISGYCGEYIFEKIRNSKQYYEQDLLEKWFLYYQKKIKVIYDIGANLGNHTVYFASHRSQAMVYAFEPLEENFYLLNRNVKANKLENVQLYPYALGDKEMQACMRVNTEGNNGTAHIDIDSQQGEVVEIKKADALKLPAPDFIKIDVEGFEYHVLQGMKQMLVEHEPYLWIEVDVATAQRVYQFLSEIGYFPQDMQLEKDNNVLFIKEREKSKSSAIVFESLLKEAQKSREIRNDLRIKTSQFEYEQKKNSTSKKELEKRTSQLEYEQKKNSIIQEELEKRTSQFEYEQKKNSIIQKELEERASQLNDEQSKVKALTKEIEEKKTGLEQQQNKAKELEEQLNDLRQKHDMYSKAKLFKILMWKWQTSTNIKYTLNKKKDDLGHTVYIKLLPYPRLKAICSRINSKLKIYPDTPKVICGSGRNTVKEEKDNGKSIKKLKAMNIAMIVDEFTYNCFKYECQAWPIEPSNWKEVFQGKDIDLFFCESAWSGVDSVSRPWKGRVYSSVNFKNENRGILLEILEYCKANHIPTVFWNKEDPTHYPDRVHDFVNTAILFDHIFTTARECVEKYKKEYGHKSVHLLMFATQPKLFNPIEKFKRKKEVIFAGSWYNQHPKRCEEMGAILDNIVKSNYALKIYDRHSKSKDPNHYFPDRFKPYLHPCLAHDKLEEAYKSSEYALNINTVTDSETMFARRVFELMSSNTLVLSNDSRGMKELFKDEVVFVNGQESIVIEQIEEKRERALYKVLKYHTYQQRLQQVLHEIGYLYEEELEDITLIFKVGSLNETEKAYSLFEKVTYEAKRIIFYVAESCSEEEFRQIIMKYNQGNVIVISQHYCQQYQDVLKVATKYFIIADERLEPTFISKALLHFQYLDHDIGVIKGENKYIFYEADATSNIVFKAACLKKARQALEGKESGLFKLYTI